MKQQTRFDLAMAFAMFGFRDLAKRQIEALGFDGLSERLNNNENIQLFNKFIDDMGDMYCKLNPIGESSKDGSDRLADSIFTANVRCDIALGVLDIRNFVGSGIPDQLALRKFGGNVSCDDMNGDRYKALVSYCVGIVEEVKGMTVGEISYGYGESDIDFVCAETMRNLKDALSINLYLPTYTPYYDQVKFFCDYNAEKNSIVKLKFKKACFKVKYQFLKLNPSTLFIRLCNILSLRDILNPLPLIIKSDKCEKYDASAIIKEMAFKRFTEL